MLAQLESAYPDDVRLIYRHFPLLTIHDKAILAVQAAEAAGREGKFWPMHDLLFAQQAEWATLSPEEFQDWLITHAPELGLDAEKFQDALQSEEIASLAQKAWEEGVNIGLPGTPFLLINGQIYSGPRDFTSLDTIVRLISLGKRQFSECPPMVIAPTRQYFATLRTEKGDIVIQLFAQEAPIAVNSFVFLARQGWYDDITFHRVIPGFIAQTGDPSGTGLGNPGYYFNDEINPSLKFDRPGVVGMANSGPDTNGSQFFITYAPAPHLDGRYTIFGQVVLGMDVLEKLTPRDPQTTPSPPPGDKLLTITIEER